MVERRLERQGFLTLDYLEKSKEHRIRSPKRFLLKEEYAFTGRFVGKKDEELDLEIAKANKARIRGALVGLGGTVGLCAIALSLTEENLRPLRQISELALPIVIVGMLGGLGLTMKGSSIYADNSDKIEVIKSELRIRKAEQNSTQSNLKLSPT